jgi:hypothetical protein
MAFTQCAKSINQADKISFEEYARNFINEYDYVIYVSPEGVEIEDNGVRTIDAEYRDLIDHTIKGFCHLYHPRMKQFHRIYGTTEERIQQVLNITGL